MAARRLGRADGPRQPGGLALADDVGSDGRHRRQRIRLRPVLIGTRLKRYALGGGIAVPLALTLAGGYVLRDSLIRAGRTSADDPRPVLSAP